MSKSALDSPVLVLNKNFAAVHVVSCRRALTLLYRSSAEVVHVQEEAYDSHGFNEWRLRSARLFAEHALAEAPDEDWIFTITYPFKVPRIIRLLRYDRYMRKKIPLTRRNVFARDEFRCQYCGVQKTSSELTIDHVTPRSKGGKETWENIVAACSRCNHRKGMRSVEAAGLTLVRAPQAPSMNPILEMNLRNQKYQSWRKFV